MIAHERIMIGHQYGTFMGSLWGSVSQADRQLTDS